MNPKNITLHCKPNVNQINEYVVIAYLRLRLTCGQYILCSVDSYEGGDIAVIVLVKKQLV